MNRRSFATKLLQNSSFLAAARTPAALSSVVCTKPPGGPRAGFFPDFILQNQDGQKVRFYSDLIEGKIVTINFFYATCDNLCPRMMSNLVRLQKLLGERVGKDVFMHSITLDPVADTPMHLRHYSEMLGIGPGWMLLTGKPEQIEFLRRRLKFTDPDPELDKKKEAHTGLLRYGNEKLDRWAGCPAISDPADIIRYLAWLKPAASSPGVVPFK